MGVGVNKKKVVGTGKTKKKVSTKIVKKVKSNLGHVGGSAKEPTRQKVKETAPTPAVVEEVEEEKRDDDSDDGMGEGDGADAEDDVDDDDNNDDAEEYNKDDEDNDSADEGEVDDREDPIVEWEQEDDDGSSDDEEIERKGNRHYPTTSFSQWKSRDHLEKMNDRRNWGRGLAGKETQVDKAGGPD